MTVRDILMLGNETLRKKSKEIDFERDNVEGHIADLRDTLRFFQKKEGIGRAIAAPQVGCLKRIVYLESEGRTIVMINPRIVSQSPETFDVWDSCFSADVAFFCRTRRHRSIHVQYWNQDREQINETFTDDLSELFQHEIDHLDGVLFTDHTIDHHIIMRSEWEKLTAV
ncbi:peptide deformylase [Desulfoluna butyratoxydans]|uniref:Peptide deformylase n=1 Tax=Desulfoluna butyratoxydans TaxID=231438 RepID=A0A4U8YL05_9BACT|nr:peptide deformylase [Desulfoluna butyratoxydans]VFQ44595.1 peptide deformylase [Desulfoluna butyratoxydans]